MKLQAVGEKIHVKELTPEREDGLVLPDDINEGNANGEIISVGPDVNNPAIKEGAKVVFDVRAGLKIKSTSGAFPDFFDMKADSITGVYTEE